MYEFETLRAVFDVGPAIKGTEGDRIMLETVASTELCGVLFREGEEYLVYAFHGPACIVTTDMRTRTATSKKAADEIRVPVSNEITLVCEGWSCIDE